MGNSRILANTIRLVAFSVLGVLLFVNPATASDYTYDETAWLADYNNIQNLSQSEKENIVYQMDKAGVISDSDSFKINVAGTQAARDRLVNNVLSDSSSYINYRASVARNNIIERDSISPEEVIISDFTRQTLEDYYKYESGLVPMPPDHPDWGSDTPPTWEEWNEIAKPILDNYMTTWETGYRNDQSAALNAATVRNAERLTSSDPAIRTQQNYELARNNAALNLLTGTSKHLSDNALGNIKYLKDFDFSVDYTETLNANRDQYNTSTSRVWSTSVADACDSKKISNARKGLSNNRSVICDVTKVVSLSNDPQYSPLSTVGINPGMPGDVVQKILGSGWEPDNAVDGSAFRAVANACQASTAGQRAIGGTVTVKVPHYYTGFSAELLGSHEFKDVNGEEITGAQALSNYFKNALSIVGASADRGTAYTKAYNAVISNWSIGRPNGGYYETSEVDCINQSYQIDTLTCAVDYNYSLRQINGDTWLGSTQKDIVSDTSISTGVNEALASGNAREVINLCLSSNSKEIEIGEGLENYGLFELNSKSTNRRIAVTYWGANQITGESARVSLGAYQFNTDSYVNILGVETPGVDVNTYLQYTCKATKVSTNLSEFSPSSYSHTECYDPNNNDSYSCYATQMLGYVNGQGINTLPQNTANIVRNGEEVAIQFPPVNIIVKDGDSLEGNPKTQIRRSGTPWNANGVQKPAGDNDLVIQNPGAAESNTGFVNDNATDWIKKTETTASQNIPTNQDSYLRVELDIAGDLSEVVVSEDGIVSSSTGKFSFNNEYVNLLIKNNVDVEGKDLIFVLSQNSIAKLQELHDNIQTQNGFIVNVDTESVRTLLIEKTKDGK